MTAAQDQEAARQKAVIEEFFRRVKQEYPHLAPAIGWKAIHNAAVHGMMRIGVYADNVSVNTFLAGLQYSMFTEKIIPAPPTVVQTVEVERKLSPEEIARAEEQQKQARQAERDRKTAERYARDVEQSRMSGYKNHAQTQTETRGMFGEVKEILTGANDAAALQACDSDLKGLIVYTAGRINHAKSKSAREELRQIVARDRNGAINTNETIRQRRATFERKYNLQKD